MDHEEHPPTQAPDVEEDEVFLSGQEDSDQELPDEADGHRPIYAGKRPRTNYGDEDPPDLGLFFDSLDVPLKERILMCRAYASYLSSQMRTGSASYTTSGSNPRYGRAVPGTATQWKRKSKH